MLKTYLFIYTWERHFLSCLLLVYCADFPEEQKSIEIALSK